MRKRDLMKALADPAGGFSNDKPPVRAVFYFDKENEECCSILGSLIRASQQTSPDGRHRDSLPLPDIDLPMVF